MTAYTHFPSLLWKSVSGVMIYNDTRAIDLVNTPTALKSSCVISHNKVEFRTKIPETE
jgi:hypothetical protein